MTIRHIKLPDISPGIRQMNDVNNNAPVAGTSHNPLLRFIDIMLQDAHKRGAEEIHIVTEPDSLSVKYMINGDIKEAMAPPLFMKPQLVGTLRRNFQLPVDGAGSKTGVLDKTYADNVSSRFILEPFQDDARFIVILVERIN